MRLRVFAQRKRIAACQIVGGLLRNFGEDGLVGKVKVYLVQCAAVETLEIVTIQRKIADAVRRV